ncbi:MAG TPA: acyltransferase [Pseudogracilibacillus sp.]|nr:acyltransferase [Pseudogracilibacillus sp.]
MNRKRDYLNKYSWVINFVLIVSKIFPKRIYLSVYKFIMPYNSYLAIFIRFICLKNCAKKCGNNVAVFPNVYLRNIEKLEIGDNVSIHPMCYIEASGEINIGDDVSIAHGSTIMSEEHIFTDLNLNIKDQGCEYKKTILENNVWIAAGSRILAGTIIGTGSIIAAGAVVKGVVKPNVIMGGVPAKILKERS